MMLTQRKSSIIENKNLVLIPKKRIFDRSPGLIALPFWVNKDYPQKRLKMDKIADNLDESSHW